MILKDEKRRQRLVGTLTTFSVVALSFSGFSSVANAAEENSAQPVSTAAETPATTPSFHTTITPHENRTYQVGERIYFQVFLRNDSANLLGVQITPDQDTNLENINKCRWSQFKSKDKATCRTTKLMPYHVVTEADAEAGSFTPKYSLSTYKPVPGGQPGQYSELIEKLPVITGAPVKIAPLPEGPVEPTPVVPEAEVWFKLTNPKTGPWSVGETLRYTIYLKNTSKYPRGFVPEGSNLDQWARCKWTRPFDPGTIKSDCNFVTHTVTEEDANRGYFEPFIKYQEVPETKGERVPIRSLAIGLENPQITGEKDSYALGDTLTFNFKVTAKGKTPVTLTTTATNLKFADGACDGELSPNTQKTCATATHVVTEADLEAGEFTPTLEVTALENRQEVQTVALRPVAIPLPNKHVWAKATGFTPHNFNPKSQAAGGLTPEQIIARQHGNTFYRIPALTVASNGDLLAAYDSRPGGAHDTPNPNSIVQRRSTDNGVTWGPETYISKATGQQWVNLNSYSDPSYIVDYSNGKIFNFHVKGHDRGWHNSARYTFDPAGNTSNDNPDAMDIHVAISDDNGHTWDHRVLTSEILRGRTDAVKAFATSGDGIQIQHGTYAGRLIQPSVWALADGTVRAASIYSDDHGTTWHLGQWTPVEGEGGRHQWDENKVVELEDGRIMVNSRVAGGAANAQRVRLVAYSADGGITWSAPKIEDELTDPVNNAHVIRAFPTAKPGTAASKVLFFSNAKHPNSRVNGTITVSCDSGETWKNATAKTYFAGHMGYSSLAILPDGTVGVLSEVAGSHMRFQRFDASWLGEQCDLSADEVTEEPKDPEPPTKNTPEIVNPIAPIKPVPKPTPKPTLEPGVAVKPTQSKQSKLTLANTGVEAFTISFIAVTLGAMGVLAMRRRHG